jgi:hypothetical protein
MLVLVQVPVVGVFDLRNDTEHRETVQKRLPKSRVRCDDGRNLSILLL